MSAPRCPSCGAYMDLGWNAERRVTTVRCPHGHTASGRTRPLPGKLPPAPFATAAARHTSQRDRAAERQRGEAARQVAAARVAARELARARADAVRAHFGLPRRAGGGACGGGEQRD